MAKLVIRIELREDEAHQPTVEDVFRHVLDALALADDGSPVVWRFVRASSNSPLTVVAESRPKRPDIPDVEEVADRQVRAFNRRMSELARGEIPREWSSGKKREHAKRFITRAALQMQRTTIESSIPTVGAPEKLEVTITPDIAVVAAKRLDDPNLNVPDLPASKEQIGAVHGRLVQVKTHYNHPAIEVQDALTGNTVTCVITDRDRQRIGEKANFDDVWRNRRVIVSGLIEYAQDRSVHLVRANEVRLLDDADIDELAIHQPDITGGLDSAEYVRRFREGTIG